MSGSADALTRLQDVAGAILTDARAPHPLRREAAAVMGAEDMVPAGQAMVPLILGLEDTAEALAAHAARLRATLTEVMLDTGWGSIRGAQHTASAVDGRASVRITDPALIPPELMRAPPPVPDKAEILRRLKAGEDVPGALLGNAAPFLSIRSTYR